MKVLVLFLIVLNIGCVTQKLSEKPDCLKAEDQILLKELFNVSKHIGNELWDKWNEYTFSILFISDKKEFLVNHPSIPKGFDFACRASGLGKIYSRKRVFDKRLLAAFPAVDMVPSVVIGNVKNTPVESSTEWLTLAFHEHFHQMQYSQPNYYELVAKLNTFDGKDAQWMTNFPFPYRDFKVNKIFKKMTEVLLSYKSLNSEEWSELYKEQLSRLKEEVGDDNYNYFRFQVWQEGVSQYIEYRALKALENYKFSKSFKNLSSYEDPKKLFAWKKKAFEVGLKKELKEVGRSLIYNIGLYEVLAKEHFNKKWEEGYFNPPLKFDL